MGIEIKSLQSRLRTVMAVSGQQSFGVTVDRTGEVIRPTSAQKIGTEKDGITEPSNLLHYFIKANAEYYVFTPEVDEKKAKLGETGPRCLS